MTQSHRNEYVAYVQYLAETELGQYAYRLVKDRADADDIVKETIAEAMRREDEFDASTGIEGLKKWVMSLCRGQAESYLPATMGANVALAVEPKRKVYQSAEESIDPLAEANRNMLRASEKKMLGRTDLFGDPGDDNEFARRLSKSAQGQKPTGSHTKQKATGFAPKSQAYTARTQQRQADTVGRSRQFFDDLLNNILASKEETEDATAGA